MDATSKPKIPAQFSIYAEENGVFQLLEHMLRELLITRPAEPLSFLQDLLSRPIQNVPKVVVYGAPATGQHSVTKQIARKLRAVHIQPRDILEQVTNYDVVEELPPYHLAEAVYAKINQDSCKDKGWILEGIPRTKEQALALQAKGVLPEHFVHLYAPDAVLIERYEGKRVDPITFDVYHMVFDRPSDPDVLARLVEEKGGAEVNLNKRLQNYHRNCQLLLSCYEKISRQFDADQPLQELVAQVTGFLHTKPRSAAPHIPRVVLLGPPGSGKSLQAAQLSMKYRLINVDCCELIRQTIMSGSKLANQMKPFHKQGLMIPDDIVMSVLKNRLEQIDCATKGWVLHGFPLTRDQAELLTSSGHKPNRVIFLEISKERIKERLCQRRFDPNTGESYHLLYNPPSTEAIKDCLVTHPKDTEEAVGKHIDDYNIYSDDLSEYYNTAQHVDGDQDPYIVQECVESIIIRPLPKQ